MNIFKQFMIWLSQYGIWFGFTMALLGAFEQAFHPSSDPIWSSVFGFPILHHYLIGFLILGISLLIYMREKIKTTKTKLVYIAQSYTKSFALILGGLITVCLSAIFQFHSLWQLDLICVDPVWQTPLWIKMFPEFTNITYASINFRDGPLYNGTLGGAYDFFLGMNAIAWVLAIVGMTLIMFGLILFLNQKFSLNLRNRLTNFLFK